MKLLHLNCLVAILALLLSSVNCPAQKASEESENRKFRFGIGTSFFNLGARQYEHNGGQASSIHLMFDLGRYIRIEPAASFTFYAEDVVGRAFFIEEPFEYAVSTLGVFGRKRYELPKTSFAMFNMLYGFRLGASFGNRDDSKVILAPTIGCELLLFEHFSLGCDVSVRQAFDDVGMRVYSNTSALLRFYF